MGVLGYGEGALVTRVGLYPLARPAPNVLTECGLPWSISHRRRAPAAMSSTPAAGCGDGCRAPAPQPSTAGTAAGRAESATSSATPKALSTPSDTCPKTTAAGLGRAEHSLVVRGCGDATQHVQGRQAVAAHGARRRGRPQRRELNRAGGACCCGHPRPRSLQRLEISCLPCPTDNQLRPTVVVYSGSAVECDAL